MNREAHLLVVADEVLADRVHVRQYETVYLEAVGRGVRVEGGRSAHCRLRVEVLCGEVTLETHGTSSAQ